MQSVTCDVKRLLTYEGENFIKEAYRGILSREADPEGMAANLEALQQRRASKLDIILSLNNSAEGRAVHVHLQGLCAGLLHIDTFLALDGEDFLWLAYRMLLGREPDALGLQGYLAAYEAGRITREEILFSMLRSDEGIAYGSRIEHIRWIACKARLKRYLRYPFSHAISREQAHANQSIVTDKLDILQKQIDGMKNDLETIRADRLIEHKSQNLFANFIYRQFEDEMRGSRQEIKNRLTFYDGCVEHVRAQNGSDLFAVDLGCGRGEWLEHLKESFGLYVLGVDMDETMLDVSRKCGLNVVSANLLHYLRRAASSSIDILTMFQVVEHLPMGVLCETLEEAYRVVRPGGVVIIETPNPENIIVGACNFYFDPTHIRKLPPALLEIMVKGVGFQQVEAARLHAYNAVNLPPGEREEPVKQLAVFFNNYADYAIVAYKEKGELRK